MKRNKVILLILAGVLKLLVVVIPILFQKMVDSAVTGSYYRLQKYALESIVVLVVLVCVQGLYSFLLEYYENCEVVNRKRSIVDEIKKARFEEKESNGLGFYLQRYTNDCDKEKYLYYSYSIEVITTTLYLVLILISLFSFSIAIGVMLWVFAAVMVLISNKVAPVIQEKEMSQANSLEEVHVLFEEYNKNYETIASMNAQDYFKKKFEMLYRKYLNCVKKVLTYDVLFDVILITLIMNGVNVFIYFFGGKNIINGTLTVGGLTAIAIYFSRLYDAMNVFIEIPKKKAKAMVARNRINEIMKESSDATTKRELEKFKELNVFDVGYSINMKDIISHFSLDIKCGETVGVYGKNGAGKSTLAKLIIKSIVPKQGKIMYNAEDYSNISEEEIKNHILLVGPETQIFNDSVDNNITLGRNSLSEDSKCFIAKSTLDRNMILHNTGNGLSSGQKKMIGLARAFSTSCEMIIFDEPLNYVDEANKMFVIEMLKKLKKTKTIIIISHEKSVFDLCDRTISI